MITIMDPCEKGGSKGGLVVASVYPENKNEFCG